ncbi:MAG: hypothetical protein HY905_02410 [Deltaproteobacteria bacterium]|nr:hypothetical protein [Deltaproteobacteria bacterium]
MDLRSVGLGVSVAFAWLTTGFACGEHAIAADDAAERDGSPDDNVVDMETDGAPEAVADVDAETDGDGGGDAGAGSLTVTILASPGSWGVSWRVRADWEWAPVEGALVAFDLPDGERRELTAAADGRVTFRDFDWLPGAEAAVTAWADGFGLASAVGIGPESSPVLLLPTLGDPSAEGVEVSGTFQNFTDMMNSFLLTSRDCGGLFWGGIDWTFMVPPGTAAELIGFEILPASRPDGGRENTILGWLVQEVGPFTEPAVVDLDFAGGASTTRVSGSFRLPARMDSPLRELVPGCSAVLVHRPNPGAVFTPIVKGVFGFATTIARRIDGAGWDYELEYVTGLDTTAASTWFELHGNGDEYSALVLPGPPAGGTLDCEFIEPASLVRPADPSRPHPLHEQITWTSARSDVTPVVAILDGPACLWWVEGPPGATSLTVPRTPSAPGARAVLGAEARSARVELQALDGDGECIVAHASTDTFLLVAP